MYKEFVVRRDESNQEVLTISPSSPTTIDLSSGDGLVLGFKFEECFSTENTDEFPMILRDDSTVIDPVFWRMENLISRIGDHYITLTSLIPEPNETSLPLQIKAAIRKRESTSKGLGESETTELKEFETIASSEAYTIEFNNYSGPLHETGVILVDYDSTQGCLVISSYNVDEEPYYFMKGGIVIWQFRVPVSLKTETHGQIDHWSPLIRFKDRNPLYGPFTTVTSVAGTVDGDIATRFVVGSGFRESGEFAYTAIVQGLGAEIGLSVETDDPKISNSGIPA